MNQSAQIFQIPWKHAARHGWSIDQDATLFRSWAMHTGRSPTQTLTHFCISFWIYYYYLYYYCCCGYLCVTLFFSLTSTQPIISVTSHKNYIFFNVCGCSGRWKVDNKTIFHQITVNGVIILKLSWCSIVFDHFCICRKRQVQKSCRVMWNHSLLGKVMLCNHHIMGKLSFCCCLRRSCCCQSPATALEGIGMKTNESTVKSSE